MQHVFVTAIVQGTYAKVKYGQHVQTGEVVAVKVRCNQTLFTRQIVTGVFTGDNSLTAPP